MRLAPMPEKAPRFGRGFVPWGTVEEGVLSSWFTRWFNMLCSFHHRSIQRPRSYHFPIGLHRETKRQADFLFPGKGSHFYRNVTGETDSMLHERRSSSFTHQPAVAFSRCYSPLKDLDISPKRYILLVIL
jgi:hypothetical protein